MFDGCYCTEVAREALKILINDPNVRIWGLKVNGNKIQVKEERYNCKYVHDQMVKEYEEEQEKIKQQKEKEQKGKNGGENKQAVRKKLYTVVDFLPLKQISNLIASNYNRIKTIVNLSFIKSQNIQSMLDKSTILGFKATRINDAIGITIKEKTLSIDVKIICENNIYLDICSLRHMGLSFGTLDFNNVVGIINKDLSAAFQNMIVDHIDFGNIDFSIVSDIGHAFSGITNLRSIKYSGEVMDLSNVANFNNLFFGCVNLEELEIFKKIKTSNKLVEMSHTFTDCKKLKEITFGEYFNASGITHLCFTFDGCIALENINIKNNSSLANLVSVNSIFNYCKSLKNINEVVHTNGIADAKIQMARRAFAEAKVEDLDLIHIKGNELTDIGACFRLTNINTLKLPRNIINDKTYINGLFSGATIDSISLCGSINIKENSVYYSEGRRKDVFNQAHIGCVDMRECRIYAYEINYIFGDGNTEKADVKTIILTDSDIIDKSKLNSIVNNINIQWAKKVTIGDKIQRGEKK